MSYVGKKAPQFETNAVINGKEIVERFSLEQFNGKIITLTGSVGKTTTVGFIQKALGDKCLRIYSKRIESCTTEQ